MVRNMFNILVTEDNPSYGAYLVKLLKRENYNASLAFNGEEALNLLNRRKFSLVVLDLMMPKMDGYEALTHIREKSDIPVLIVSAKDLPEDKKKAFLRGTDDYLIKPIDEDEFLLRIKALLRRAKIESDKCLKVGSLVLDYPSFSAKEKGKDIPLTRKEFLLLYKLLSNPDVAFTRLELLEEMWGYEAESEEATVSVHINRLRQKFKDSKDFEINTVWGIGYKAVIRDEEKQE